MNEHKSSAQSLRDQLASIERKLLQSESDNTNLNEQLKAKKKELGEKKTETRKIASL